MLYAFKKILLSNFMGKGNIHYIIILSPNPPRGFYQFPLLHSMKVLISPHPHQIVTRFLPNYWAKLHLFLQIQIAAGRHLQGIIYKLPCWLCAHSLALVWSNICKHDCTGQKWFRRQKGKFLAVALLLIVSVPLREVTLPLCTSVFIAIKYVW